MDGKSGPTDARDALTRRARPTPTRQVKRPTEASVGPLLRVSRSTGRSPARSTSPFRQPMRVSSSVRPGSLPGLRSHDEVARHIYAPRSSPSQSSSLVGAVDASPAQ
jgi:hypothetical protein